MNERTIFMEALEHDSPDRRAEFLDSACAGDAPLRQRVEALLVSHEQASGFLARPASEGLAERLSSEPTTDVTLDGAAADELDGDELEFLTPSDKPGALGRLGHYDILETIGRGGMGIVLRAFDEKLHRVVAIKVMASQLATSTLARKRFAREAHAAAAVSHEHVVTIHAVEEANGRPFIVMHYVGGLSLQERLDRDGPLELHEILRIGMQTASGLAAAHAQGLIHRDIKPDNILLENGVERVKITDFGLARVADDASLTQSGVVAGTPHYMAPEQARGEALDTRTDLFSLGSVLYAMCTGRTPFRASGSMAVLKRVCEDTPTPIRETNPEMPDWLAAIIDKLHAKDPAERFQTAAEVADLLGRHLAHVQHPSVVPLPAVSSSAFRRSCGRPPEGGTTNRRYAIAAAIMLVCLLGGLSLTEATGVTQLASTVIHIFTPEGTLAVEVNDPAVKVTIEGDGGLLITGAGPQEVRLKPGSYKVLATKDGQPVPLERELVSIARGGRAVVKVKLEPPTASPRVQSQFSGEVRRFEGHTGPVKRVDFSPDGKLALSGSGYPQGDRSVRLWNVAAGKQIRSFDTSGTQILTVGFSPDGGRAAAGGFGGVVRIWETATGRLVATLETNTEVVEDVAFSADGQHLLCVTHKRTFPTQPGQSGWGKAQLWDTKTEKLDWEFESDGWLTACGFTRDGEQVLVSGRQTGCAMVLLDRKTGKQLQRYTLANVSDFQIEDLAVSHDGRFVATAAESGYVNLWDPSTPGKPIAYRSNLGNLRSVAFSPDDSQLLCGSGEGETGRIDLLDVPSLRVIDSLEHPSGLVWSVAYAPDGRHALSAGGFAKEPADGDYAMRLWRLTQSVPLKATSGVSEPGAFVLQGGKGVAERKFDTLAEAVQRSSDGDTIEIRGNGPFVSDGVTVDHRLVMRAGKGCRPTISLSRASAEMNISLMRVNAPLVLEGLELQRIGKASNTAENKYPRLFTSWSKTAALHLANCRLVLNALGRPWGNFFDIHPASFTMRNCELNGKVESVAGWYYASGGRCTIENCVSAGGYAGFHHKDADVKDVSIRLRGNTMAGDCMSLVLWKRPSLPEEVGAAPPVRLDFSRNVVGQVSPVPQARVLLFHQFGFDESFSAAEAEALLPRILHLNEQHNVYPSGGRMLQLMVNYEPLDGTRGLDLADWNRYWNQQNTGSLEGEVRFQGGDLAMRARTAPEKLTPEDFRLRPDSAGYRAGPDGKDLGADVDLVGPGAAYERWKKTPEYQEWLKETKQAREAARATTESEVFAKELAKWQGEWENPKYGKLVIKGDRWASYPQKGFEVVSKIKIVEVSDEMTHILLLSAGVDGKVRTIQTILRVDGDTLHNCGTIGSVRPTEFANQPGFVYTQWKRVSNSKP